MTVDRTMAEIDEAIAGLCVELCVAEDNGQCERAGALRSYLRELRIERDLLPRQREP